MSLRERDSEPFGQRGISGFPQSFREFSPLRQGGAGPHCERVNSPHSSYSHTPTTQYGQHAGQNTVRAVSTTAAIVPFARAERPAARARRGYGITTYLVLLAAVLALGLGVAQATLVGHAPTQVYAGIPELPPR